MTEPASIRFAKATDFDRLEQIETLADALFVDRFGDSDWPAATPAVERASYPGFTLVVSTEAHGLIGFVQVIEADGLAHLEQLSVLPERGRNGYGRMLVSRALDEAARRGYETITLRTYRDVPWNAPFYASCGFSPSVPATPWHRSLVEVEARLGLDRWGERVQMTALLRHPGT